MSTPETQKRQDLLGLDLEELRKLIEPVSPLRYTAGQVFGWVYAKGVFNFYQMHNLSKTIRATLNSKYCIQLPNLVRSVSSERERVSKYLLSLSDGSAIECVLVGMRDKDTFCVSTQVGCGFGCVFCATGRMGLKRNLTAAEILGQVLFLRSACGPPGRTGVLSGQGRSSAEAGGASGPPDTAPRTSVERGESPAVPTEIPFATTAPEGSRDRGKSHLAPTETARAFNIVLMGMGEPLDNYENTVKAIRIMQHPDGLAVGGRRITVSTCGIPDKIKRLAREDLGVGLALSLNATTDELRSKLIPAGRKFRLKQVLEATRYFAEKSGRRITLEYVLVAGVNDRPSDVRRLISIASSMPCKINLIALNSSSGVKLEPPSEEAVQRFARLLYPHAPAVTLRKSKGSDIMAACGQLRTDIERAGPRQETRPRQERKPGPTGARQPRTRPRPKRRRDAPATDASRGRPRATGRPRRQRRTDAARGTSPTSASRPAGRGRQKAPTPSRGDRPQKRRREPSRGEERGRGPAERPQRRRSP